MCDPISITIGTLAVASMATSIAGGVTAANAQKAQGKASQNYYNYIAEQNRLAAEAAEKTGEQKDTLSQNQGALESQKVSRTARQFEGAQKASLAANKIGGGSVTAADLILDTFDKSRLDEIAVRFNADTRSYEAKENAKYTAWDLRNQEKLNRMAGSNARMAGNAAANATKINTVSSVLDTASSTLGSVGTYRSSLNTKAYNSAPPKPLYG